MTKSNLSLALATLVAMSVGSFVAAQAEPAAQSTSVVAPASTTVSTGVATSPELARAIAYTLPASECKPPKFPRRGTNFRGEAESLNKLHKYIECLNDRSRLLKADFEFLRNSVRSGATKAQADVVGGNLRVVYQELHQLQELARKAEEAEVASAGPGVYRNPELAR